jgi:hypothetical protein
MTLGTTKVDPLKTGKSTLASIISFWAVKIKQN